MVSWLYGLLLGLGIASGVLSAFLFIGGIIASMLAATIMVCGNIAVIFFSVMPAFVIASAVLISVCLSVGKN